MFVVVILTLLSHSHRSVTKSQMTLGAVDSTLLLKYAGLHRSNQNATAADLYINGGGLYLLTSRVLSTGRVSAVCAFGYTKVEFESLLLNPNSQDIDPQTTVRPFVYVVLLRSRTGNNHSYSMAGPPAILAHGYSFNCISDSDGLHWDVQEGDLIGAFIPSDCVMVDSIQKEILFLKR